MGTSRSSKRRLRIFNRDKGICHWCRQPTVWTPNDTWQSKRRMATVDHLVNKAQAKEMGITEAERNKEERPTRGVSFVSNNVFHRSVYEKVFCL